MSGFPTLQLQRLTLREIELTDAASILEVFGDPERMKWFGIDPLENIGEAEKLIESFAKLRELPSTGIRWGIQLNGSENLSGTCGFFAWNQKWRKCVIGYALSKSAGGLGYMGDALNAAIEWGWSEMELNRIEAQVHLANTESLKLLERMGFKYEGLLRQVGYWGGKHHDLCQYSLLKEDWVSGT
jgi:[ribosomal protein S5]-alanine N-acetyltransferase